MSTLEVISVSQYLDRLNKTLKGEKARVLGEVCNVQMYEGRSYLYFSIKDSKDQSTVKCFMWKRDFTLSGVQLRDGLEVVVTAYPSIYKPNGGLGLQVELIEMVGEGALQLAYEQLKKKLELEGLFSLARKRELPAFPKRIGVVTSKSGAVINDFLTNIGKFGFEIIFVDSKVEGQDAIKDLLSGLKTLEKKDLDVLVMMRGGGSLESFQAFNNEALVRAVAEFPVPVLTGIGHDKDAPLVSLVSDKNVSTPTAVANLLNSTWSEALGGVRLSEEKIFSNFQSLLKDKQYFVENSEVTISNSFGDVLDEFKKAETTLVHSTTRIESEIKRIFDHISIQSKELSRGFGLLVTNIKDTIVQSAKTLELSSPERQLARGYSIIKVAGRVVRAKKDLHQGDSLDIQVSDGTIEATVI